jgi:hypothetical protein
MSANGQNTDDIYARIRGAILDAERRSLRDPGRLQGRGSRAQRRAFGQSLRPHGL